MTQALAKTSHPGIVTANLAAPSEHYDLSSLVAKINATIKPPTPVGEGDVYIRAMYIVSDAINAFGGRFPADEHMRLVELLVDAPVLVGHRKDQLPVGRNFHAVVEIKDGQSWVKSYFYWLKSSEGALSLRDNIDGGIYKECSIGFMYGLAECSICGSDMRSCQHTTNPDGSVWFNYRQIQRVLETSLVYRGATPDTSISRDLQIEKWAGSVAQVQPREWNPRPIHDLDELDSSAQYVVAPAYEGVPVLVNLDATMLEAMDLNSKVLLSIPIKEGASYKDVVTTQFEGLLVGMRGKDRCNVAETNQYLSKGRGPVSRMELRLFPHKTMSGQAILSQCGELSIRQMRGITALKADVPLACRNFQTREGAYLWRVGCSPFGGEVRRFVFGQKRVTQSVALQAMNNTTDVVLEITGGNSARAFIMPEQSLNQLKSGKSIFIQDFQYSGGRVSCAVGSDRHLSGVLIREEGKGMVCSLTGSNTHLHVRPIRINGAAKYLIYFPNLKNNRSTRPTIGDRA